MRKTLDFFLDVGRLKGKKRRGWIINRIRNSESTAEHIFRMAIISWVLSKKKRLDVKRVLKMALVHDLCEVYAEDITPYDPLLGDDAKENNRILKSWPKFSIKQKKDNIKWHAKVDRQGMLKLLSGLPRDLRREMITSWEEFEQGNSREAKFVRQVDKFENFLQGMEYCLSQGKIQYRLWFRWIKEIIDDPHLIKLVWEIEKKFKKK